jgi:hypothetical protein
VKRCFVFPILEPAALEHALIRVARVLELRSLDRSAAAVDAYAEASAPCDF